MSENLFTDEEIQNLRNQMSRVGSHLPEDMAGLIWSSYTKIIGRFESQPCTCGKNGSIWGNAVQTVREYLNGLS